LPRRSYCEGGLLDAESWAAKPQLSNIARRSGRSTTREDGLRFSRNLFYPGEVVSRGKISVRGKGERLRHRLGDILN